MRNSLRLVRCAGRLLVPALVACSLLLLLLVGLGPRTGAYRTVTVLTGSMAPTMPVGAVVVSTPSPLEDVRVGDVITYRIPVEDRRVVTHRVVEVVRPGPHPVVRTRGDANAAPDPWTAELKGDRVWRARLTIPRLGLLLEDLRQPWVRRLLLMAVPLALAGLWLKDIWRRKEELPLQPQPQPPVPSTPAWPGMVALGALLSLGAAGARGRA